MLDKRTTPSPAALAARLFDAFESGVPVAPPTEGHPDLDVHDAYAVQQALVQMHVDAGRRVVGRKIGLTSLAMQRQLGVDAPDFGVVLDSHRFQSGVRLSRSAATMIAPKLEPELAVVLERKVAGPGVTLADVAAALTAVVPVIEIIDSRVSDWRIGLVDTIADNASCFGIVEGDAISPGAVGPLDAVEVALSREHEVLQRGRGAAVMGHPLEAVAWLANELGAHGDALPAGQPVLCGSFTAAVDALAGSYVADFGPAVGCVTLEVSP